MKGLILCAGKGTRLRPFTSYKPKPLLPVVNQPVLFYCIEKLAEQGIREIGIVIQPGYEAMFRQETGDGERWGVQIEYLYQSVPQGIAHAVKEAASFLKQEPFVLLLGDNLIAESLEGLCCSIREDASDAAILLKRVPNPKEFGIAEIAGNRVISLEEKPQQPKSDLAVVGAYAFQPVILKAIDSIPPSRRGEYEITDAIQWLIQHGYSVTHAVTDKPYSDVGTPKRWLQANRWMLDRAAHRGANQDQGNIRSSIIRPPVSIDPSSVLINCDIGPYVSIGPNVTLEGVRMKDCIVMDGVRIAAKKTKKVMRYTIISPNAVYIEKGGLE